MQRNGTAERPSVARGELHPAVYVRSRVISPDCTLPDRSRWLATVLADRLHPDGTAFCSVADLAERSGMKVRTVERYLRPLYSGPEPLFARSWPGETRGHKHRTPRYTVIRNVPNFTAARDRHEARTADEIDRVITSGTVDERREYLQAQSRFIRGEIDQRELDRFERRLRRAATERVRRGIHSQPPPNRRTNT